MPMRIISFVLSLIMSVSGGAASFFASAIDSVAEIICGIPYTASAVKDELFSEFDADDIGFIDNENGYIRNTLAVFVEPRLGFFERLGIFRNCGGAVIGWCAPAELYIIRTADMSHEEALEKCQRIGETDGVELAMPLYLSKTADQLTPDDPFDYMFEEDAFYPENPVVWDELDPNGRNWWLEAINARQAWDYESYFQPVNIGVLDSGFDPEHPDLEGQITFPNEKRARKNRPSDHGCHVSGIIAAKRNNATGISGICDHAQLICVDWNPDLFQFWFTEIAIYFGFTELVQAGAKVINMSFGIASSVSGGTASLYDRVLKPMATSLTMASLLSKGYDFLVVQSAGNGNSMGIPIDSTNNGHFAAVTEKNIYTGKHKIAKEEILGRILTVSAASDGFSGEFELASYSNVGRYVGIAAPGSMVFSCGYPLINDYDYKSGTSMAAPCVTGVAGLVWSVNPSFTGREVREIIVNSTDRMAKVSEFAEYIYCDEVADYPMLNAKLAVEEAIRRTDSAVGTVSGAVGAEGAATIEFSGIAHTVFSDGSFSFVAHEGDGTAVIRNASGDEIGSFELTVIAGETTDTGIV
ncbi:MAG: S8 family serine peptidase [Clostridia bacterium]|nr:S8 family serine peptidase [Clostridia bacterium]